MFVCLGSKFDVGFCEDNECSIVFSEQFQHLCVIEGASHILIFLFLIGFAYVL